MVVIGDCGQHDFLCYDEYFPSVWLSVDPLAHWYPTTSPYAYVLNNPVNLIDPTGMSSEEPGGIGGFFQKVGNWFGGNDFKTDQQVADATPRVMLDEVTVTGSYDKQLYSEQNSDGSTTSGGFKVGYIDGNSEYSLSGFNVGYQFDDGKASVEATGLSAEVSGENNILGVPLKSSTKGKVFHARAEVISQPNRVAVDAGAYAAKVEGTLGVPGLGSVTAGGSFGSAHIGFDAGAYTRPDGTSKWGFTFHIGLGVGIKGGFAIDTKKKL
jgi:hypothetical protein